MLRTFGWCLSVGLLAGLGCASSSSQQAAPPASKPATPKPAVAKGSRSGPGNGTKAKPSPKVHARGPGGKKGKAKAPKRKKTPQGGQDAVAKGEARRKRQLAELRRMEREQEQAMAKQRKEIAKATAPTGRNVRTVDAMRKPRKTDAKLEAEFKEAFEQRLDWGETAVKVVLMSDDWSIERHPATGVVMRRTFEVDIAGKKPDGTIMVYSFLMQQEALGPKSWGKAGRSSHTALGYIEPSKL